MNLWLQVSPSELLHGGVLVLFLEIEDSSKHAFSSYSYLSDSVHLNKRETEYPAGVSAFNSGKK